MEKSRRAGHRHARLSHLLSEALEAVVRDELSDPSIEEVSLTAIDLSPDGHHVFVHFVAPDPASAAEALSRASPFVRTCIADRLGLDRVPHVHFEKDPRCLE